MTQMPAMAEFDSFPLPQLEHPVVLRFAEMFPSGLAGFEMHGQRSGGQLDHVDHERSQANRILIGSDGWRRDLLKEIERARRDNLQEELAALLSRKRKTEHAARREAGLQDPWRSSKGGPLREVILTAHRHWFAGRSDEEMLTDAPARADRFEIVHWTGCSRASATVWSSRAPIMTR